MNENNSKREKMGKSRLFVVPRIPPARQAKVVLHSESGHVVVQSEFSDQLEERTKAYINEYKPLGITELSLVRDLAAAECRCEYTQKLLDQMNSPGDEKLLASLTRYQEASRALFRQSLKLLRKVQKARSDSEARKPHLVRKRKAGEC